MGRVESGSAKSVHFRVTWLESGSARLVHFRVIDRNLRRPFASFIADKRIIEEGRIHTVQNESGKLSMSQEYTCSVDDICPEVRKSGKDESGPEGIFSLVSRNSTLSLFPHEPKFWEIILNSLLSDANTSVTNCFRLVQDHHLCHSLSLFWSRSAWVCHCDKLFFVASDSGYFWKRVVVYGNADISTWLLSTPTPVCHSDKLWPKIDSRLS